MATPERRTRNGKVRWYARYRDPDGKQRVKVYDRKVDAQAFLDDTTSAMRRGTYIDVHDTTTVAEYARRWAATRPHKETTARRVRSLIETHVAGTPLGRQRLPDVLPSEVQAWATDRSKVLAPSTLRLLVSLLRSVYASAVLDRLVAHSPVVRVQ